MINGDDLNKAEQNINELFELRDKLINASPYLLQMKNNVVWYREVCQTIPEISDEVLSLISEPVQGTLLLNAFQLDLGSVTGATGSFYAVSGDTKQIIKSYGSKHYDLITKYEAFNKTEDLIASIAAEIGKFRPDLVKYNPVGALLEASGYYEKWKAGTVGNSVLAAEIRSFQDIFNGVLPLAADAAQENSGRSWPRMSEALGKTGNSCRKTLRNLQGKEEQFHLDFTEIFKKTKVVNKLEMSEIFDDYIIHVYALLNLVDLNLFY